MTLLHRVAWLGGFVAAVTVLAAGVGLGLPHLAKEGPTTHTAVGVVLVLVGLAAAARAGTRLLSGVRRRWWVLWLPGLVVTSLVALWTVGQGVAAGLPAHPELGRSTPAAVGLDYRDVRLRTSDDVRLAAWWVPSHNEAAVVLLHGAGSTRTAALDEAAVLGGAGYGVLLLDARGHGASGGRGMDFGWYGERDVAAAVDFLTGEGIRRVGLVGLSMGGESALGAAGDDARVRAVVAEGATHRVAADKGYLDAFGFRGDLQQVLDRVTYGVAGLVSSAPAPPTLRESVVSSHAPTLLVTAGRVTDERLAAMRLRAADPGDVEVWTVPEAAHVGGLGTAPESWRDRVVGFLDAALGQRTARAR